MKTCCFVGHKDIPKDKLGYVVQELHREVDQAIKNGYTLFVCGFAEGADLLFAQVVCEYKDRYNNVRLEAALPYRKWASKKDDPFTELLDKCDIVGIHSEDYSPECFMKRDAYMVNISDSVIAVCGDRWTNGTDNMISYARTQGKKVRIIVI